MSCTTVAYDFWPTLLWNSVHRQYAHATLQIEKKQTSGRYLAVVAIVVCARRHTTDPEIGTKFGIQAAKQKFQLEQKKSFREVRRFKPIINIKVGGVVSFLVKDLAQSIRQWSWRGAINGGRQKLQSLQLDSQNWCSRRRLGRKTLQVMWHKKRSQKMERLPSSPLPHLPLDWFKRGRDGQDDQGRNQAARGKPS